jgi:hypothetical protein
VISDEWKEVSKEDMEVLKEEADRMNASNVKKLPKLTESGEEDWSETEDPSFNESSRKPILLKIKKETDEEQSRSVIDE